MIKQIDILGLTYQISEVPIIDKGDYILGQIDYVKQIIKLDEDVTPDKKMQTLMHEILHGILEQLGEDDINVDEGKVQGIRCSPHARG